MLIVINGVINSEDTLLKEKREIYSLLRSPENITGF